MTSKPHNVEFSCPAASDLRSPPADLLRLVYDPNSHLRGQLQRDVLHAACPTQPSALRGHHSPTLNARAMDGEGGSCATITSPRLRQVLFQSGGGHPSLDLRLLLHKELFPSAIATAWLRRCSLHGHRNHTRPIPTGFPNPSFSARIRVQRRFIKRPLPVFECSALFLRTSDRRICARRRPRG